MITRKISITGLKHVCDHPCAASNLGRQKTLQKLFVLFSVSAGSFTSIGSPLASNLRFYANPVCRKALRSSALTRLNQLQVKAGGHNGNPGFADTAGVQIALSRLSMVEYDAASQTVAVGPGLLWEDVYAALETHGVNVVGGRTPGVGVSGFSLGGGMCL